MFGIDIGSLAKGIMEGFVGPLFSFLNKKEDVSLEKFKVDGQVDQTLIAATVQLAQVRASLLKSQWMLALQFGFGFPLMVYYGKCILWDKVFGWGSTDPLKGDIATYSMWIVSFLFLHSAIDNWGRKT